MTEINYDHELYFLVALEVVAERWVEHVEAKPPEELDFADAALLGVLKRWIQRRNQGEVPKSTASEFDILGVDLAHQWLALYQTSPRTPHGEIAAAALTRWMVSMAPHRKKEGS